MRKTRWRVLPEVHPEARLIEDGPYRWIRHPMYASLLLVAAGLLADKPNVPRLIAGTVLVLSLALKIHLEEMKLSRAFPRYAEYAARTKRLIPRLW